MRAAEFNALEKVFGAEIEGRLYQSRAKIYRELESAGMVKEVTETPGGGLPVRVTGRVLTHRGRIAYCGACANVADGV